MTNKTPRQVLLGLKKFVIADYKKRTALPLIPEKKYGNVVYEESGFFGTKRTTRTVVVNERERDIAITKYRIQETWNEGIKSEYERTLRLIDEYLDSIK